MRLSSETSLWKQLGWRFETQMHIALDPISCQLVLMTRHLT